MLVGKTRSASEQRLPDRAIQIAMLVIENTLDAYKVGGGKEL
jgi:hypothetical protein